MTKLDKNKIKEEDHQKMFVKYLEMLKRKGKVIEFFANVNENKQSYANRNVAVKIEAKSKSMGKRVGLSDMTIILKNKVLFIELKRAKKVLKNGSLSSAGISVSDYQLEFLNKVNSSNVCRGVVCYGFDEAKEYIDKQIEIDEILGDLWNEFENFVNFKFEKVLNDEK